MRTLLRVLCLMTAAGLPFVAWAQDQGSKGQTVRPGIGKPLQAAVDLLKAKRSRDALAKAREAQAIPDKTPYESYLATRVFAQAAAAAGEASASARAFESAAAALAAPEAERRQFLAAAAGQYYLAKDYAKAADLAARYLRQGGSDRSIRTIYVQALYLGNNFALAAREISADVDAEEKAGKAPSEEQLQLLANAYQQSLDSAGYASAMEKLLMLHPKRDYWLNVLYGMATRPGFSERLALGVARLKLETGTLRSEDEYLEAAQLSLLEGFPIEATKFIDQGYAAGVLGSGAGAERHKRLKDMAAKNVAEDRKALAAGEGTAAKVSHTLLFNQGLNYVLNGEAGKGLEMMQQGLRAGAGSRRPEHAKLELAYAYHLAGQKEKAIQTFRSVQGTDGAAALARLWVIRLSRAS
jgi:hypothetical protein